MSGSGVLARRALLAGAFGLPLAGCGGLGWLGEAEDAPLKGDRKAVLLLEDALSADPRAADVPIALPRARRNPDWPQAGGSATHAAYHLEVGDTIRAAWRADIGAGAGRRSRLIAAPVAAGGRVYTADADGELAAFDAATGRPAWRAEPNDTERNDRQAAGGLAHADGLLVATYGTGLVLALDAGTGAEVWRQALKAPVRSAPTAADGRVLVLAADNQLFALDQRTGEIAWRHAGLFEQAGILGGASPAAAGGLAVAAYSSGEVFGLELASGRPLWSETVLRPRRTLALNTITDIIGDPVIDRDRVLVAGVSGEMAALDAARGARIWTANVTTSQLPWAAGDVVYLLTDRGELVAILRENGQIRWASPLGTLSDPDDPDSRRVRWSGPLLVGDRLLVAGSEGVGLSVSPYTGEILGRVALAGPVSLPPIAADGTVYFLTDEGELLAYR